MKTETVYNYDAMNCPLPPRRLMEFRDWVCSMIEKVPVDCREDAVADLHIGSDGSFTIDYRRPLTAQEEADELEFRKRREVIMRTSELEQLARLKAKYPDAV